ncbi:MAG: hypothetical protein P8X65_05530 [Syntrophobacterales bacterium]|jgi:hypothetical protein
MGSRLSKRLANLEEPLIKEINLALKEHRNLILDAMTSELAEKVRRAIKERIKDERPKEKIRHILDFQRISVQYMEEAIEMIGKISPETKVKILEGLKKKVAIYPIFGRLVAQ